jgi:D-arabinose 1-dehydrogenase-like Zn-dependent alcohol dehydrogenase
VRAGALRAPAVERFAMADAAEAHRRMEAGELRGRALLVP